MLQATREVKVSIYVEVCYYYFVICLFGLFVLLVFWCVGWLVGWWASWSVAWWISSLVGWINKQAINVQAIVVVLITNPSFSRGIVCGTDISVELTKS